MCLFHITEKQRSSCDFVVDSENRTAINESLAEVKKKRNCVKVCSSAVESVHACPLSNEVTCAVKKSALFVFRVKEKRNWMLEKPNTYRQIKFETRIRT